jgi:hypothetical protein
MVAVVLMLALLFGLVACNGDNKNQSQASNTPVATATITASATASPCPTQNAKAFAKTRMVGNVALAGGAFHRYIWKAYKDGKYTQSGKFKRYVAYGKGALATAFIVNRLKHAYGDAQANPTFCKFVKPLGSLQTAFTNLQAKFKNRSVQPADITSDNTLLNSFEKTNSVKDMVPNITGAS